MAEVRKDTESVPLGSKSYGPLRKTGTPSLQDVADELSEGSLAA